MIIRFSRHSHLRNHVPNQPLSHISGNLQFLLFQVLLSDPLFSYSRLYFAIFLNGLSSICILLCEKDAFDKELDTHEQFNAFAQALEQLITRDLEGITHEEFEKYSKEEGLCDPRRVIQGGLSEGIRSVSQPSAPPEEYVCTVNNIL